MYCENCGRLLKDGEKCICRKKQKIVKKSKTADPGRKKGFNVGILVSVLFLAAGAALFALFRFQTPTFLDALPISGLDDIKEYLYNVLPLILFIAGMIAGILAVKKKRFRAGAYFGLVCNIAGILFTVGVTAWQGYQSYQLDRLMEGELTDQSRDKIYAAYSEAEENAPVKERIESKLTSELSEVVEDYNNNRLSYEEAQDRVSSIASLNVADNAGEVQNELNQLHGSKENFEKAAELEADEANLLQASALYAQVLESDSNYETAQKKIAEISDQVSGVIAGGITEENIAAIKNFYESGDSALKDQIGQTARQSADAIAADFAAKKVSLEDARDRLALLQDFAEAEESVAKSLADIEKMNESAAAFEQAAKLEEEGKAIPDAIAYYEKVIESDPNYADAQNRIAELNKEIGRMVEGGITSENIEIMAEIYQTSDEAVKTKLDQKARELAQTILTSYGDDSMDYEEAGKELAALDAFEGASEEIGSFKSEIERLYQSKQAFLEAEELSKDPEKLLDAVKKYQSVAEDDANYESAQAKAAELLGSLVETCKSDASALVKENNFKEAISALDNCLEIVPDSEELLALKEQYVSDYVEYAAGEAQRLLSEKNYDEAKSVLSTAFLVTADPSLQESREAIDGYRPAALADMHIMDGHDYEVNEEITDSYGNQHFDAMRINAGFNGCLLYQLDGQYSSFSGNVVSPDDGTSSDASMDFAIFADDVLVYSADHITRQQGAKEISIELTNVQQLMIQTTGTDYWSSNLCITEGMFERNPDAPEAKKAYCRLRENVVIDSESTETYDGLVTDAYGNFHNGSLKLDSYDGGYALYNLNQQYTNLSGKIVAGDDTDVNATITVQIYLDDELAYTSPAISKTTEEADFSLDVTGRKVLKITSSGANVDYWAPYCYIVDDKLYFESTEELKQLEAETLAQTTEKIEETAIHRYEYFLLDGTWEDAFSACIARGGYLVRINSQEEYDYILQQIDKEDYRKYQFYIGGRRSLDSREYYWAEDTNELSGIVLNDPGSWCAPCWMLGEPTFEDSTLDVEEHVMNLFYYSEEGRWVWNDVPNNLPDVAPNYKGKIGYICEFEN